MNLRHALSSILLLAGLLAAPGSISAQDATPSAGSPSLPPPSSNVSLFAESLDNPRGLEFGPDGMLYVAEGGQGGTTATTADQCEQVVAPVGPYTGGDTARISKLDAGGTRTTVADGLPSNQTSPDLGSLVAGVSDIAFVDGTLYALISGGGCSHGHPNDPNGVIKVYTDGTTELVADLSAFVKANPVANPNPADFEPDEGAYGLEAWHGQLYVTESNHGALDRVDPSTGEVTRVLDLSATEGHIVPTAEVVGPDGNLYLSNLFTFPVMAGDANVYTVMPDGTLSVFATGVTAVLGLAFDDQGRLYVLETSGPGVDGPITPGTGRVVRLMVDGGLEVVATGLVLPTGMAMGADGLLYVSNYGYGFPPGAGQVVTIDLTAPLPDQSIATPSS
jgi:sugar lactone lactonase YvrE